MKARAARAAIGCAGGRCVHHRCRDDDRTDVFVEHRLVLVEFRWRWRRRRFQRWWRYGRLLTRLRAVTLFSPCGRRRVFFSSLRPFRCRSMRPGRSVHRRCWRLGNVSFSRRAADFADDLGFQFCVSTIRASSTHAKQSLSVGRLMPSHAAGRRRGRGLAVAQNAIGRRNKSRSQPRTPRRGKMSGRR